MLAGLRFGKSGDFLVRVYLFVGEKQSQHGCIHDDLPGRYNPAEKEVEIEKQKAQPLLTRTQSG